MRWYASFGSMSVRQSFIDSGKFNDGKFKTSNYTRAEYKAKQKVEELIDPEQIIS